MSICIPAIFELAMTDNKAHKIVHTDLFQAIDFTSHAGKALNWKIECDALSTQEWDCLAQMIYEYEPRNFGEVVGIPRGGLPLARALEGYATGNDDDPILIVDDVLTTGGSMNTFQMDYFRNRDPRRGYIGWVVFSRAPLEHANGWINALFMMPHVRKL